ncbi:MAG: hypothetical protein GX195_10815 [Firmicutes bacterium]|nr:hypothetical protein [Bacillota bacterium]
MVLRVFREILLAFASSLGVILGGAILGSTAAFFTRMPPGLQMREMARVLRMWAVVVAIGGTFPTLRVIESGLFSGQVFALLRQLAVIIAALLGASSGYWLVTTLTGGE